MTMNRFLEFAASLAPFVGTLAAVAVALAAINWFLKRRWRDDPDAQFRFQLIMLALTFSGVLAVVLALPISEETRGQLLSLIGILLSAAIALSSTTFIGNIMAGIMLKVVRSARPGDFITVANLTGRITEMDLLHTEVQTEFRDLVTVPNLFMVTQPMQVVRASGSIITAEVSLGYDVSHARVTEILCNAAEKAGLKDNFVHVRELGDFSVLYRVAGLLEDIQSLISARSALRKAMLDALHDAKIEIVSPNFMNTRAVHDDKLFIPLPSRERRQPVHSVAESVAFDKAEDAASLEKIRVQIQQIDEQITALSEEKNESNQKEQSALEVKKAHLIEQLKTAEENIKAKESAEKQGT
jgi:small-conductance mechanosensitive channel